MTTFEITIIAMLAIIMLFIIIFVKTAIGGFHDVSQQLNANLVENVTHWMEIVPPQRKEAKNEQLRLERI